MADYTLHCFAQSGNAYKPALMLELCGADWAAEFVDFFNGAARGEAYRALNEMAEVPTLIQGDLTLTQSGVMLDYLSQQFQKFGADNDSEHREILRWTLWDNHKFTAQIATWRFMTNFLPEKHRNPDVIKFLEGRARAGFGTLEQRLAGRDWIAADRMTTADISCAGYIYFLDEIGIDPAEYPNISRWRDAIAALEGWKHPYDLMPGHPLPAKS